VIGCTVQELPLGLDLRFAGYDRVFLKLDHLPCRKVVRALAVALVSQTNANGPIKAPWTAKAYKNAIVQFATWLHGRGFDGDLADVTVEHLYGFGASCSAAIERSLRVLLKASITSGGERPVTPLVAEHLDGVGVARQPRLEALDPYTRGEYERLVEACRDEISAWEATRAVDPPGAAVVLAFRVLLGLEFGLPADSLTKLRVSGVRWQGEHEVRVEYLKPRGDGPQALTFRHRGPWSGPGLLLRWMRASKAMRAHAGEHADSLWLWLDSAGQVRPALFGEYEWRPKRLAFLDAHALRDDDRTRLALDFRRLRTTWIARKSRYWHGAVTVDPNHTAAVEGDHYVTGAARPDEVASLVEEAQRDLLRRAEHVALVLTPDAELADRVDGPDASRVRAEHEQPAVHGGEWDMFAAACRDPFDSPFSPKGSFCVAAVWSCLVCPLAVITPSKLPALLRLQDYLQQRSAEVDERAWAVAYAPAWVQLTTRILPRFDETALAAARAALENDDDLPSVPVDPLRTA
jgi:hypothetical protein